MATKKLSKAKRDIINQVHERWTNTVLEGAPNVEAAKRCLTAAYKNGIGSYKSYETIKEPVFHVVQSPIAFAIAHAVKRGRMSKKRARNLCFQFGIDFSPFATMRRDKTLRWRDTVLRWYADPVNECTRTWVRLVDEVHREREERMAAERNTGINHWRWSRAQPSVELSLRVNSFDLFAPCARSAICDANVPGTDTRGTINAALNEFLNCVLVGTSSTLKTMNTLDIAYRWGIDRINRAGVADEEGIEPTRPALRHELSPEDAEIMCRLFGVDDPLFTWEYEVFHHLTAFAAFEESCIILADRPKMHLDDEQNLHNENGPAVEWPDGLKLWFNHGHFLDEGGKTIITAPEKLTTDRILDIANEETKRVAIERYGWEKFLAEANCPVLDRRQNDIDNTIEILVGPPAKEATNWQRTNRMILFCRSTGRRYLLNVPNDTTTCQEAQNWMANANRIDSSSVPYASHEMRLVGAS
jgi:hypothetical protein